MKYIFTLSLLYIAIAQTDPAQDLEKYFRPFDSTPSNNNYYPHKNPDTKCIKISNIDIGFTKDRKIRRRYGNYRHDVRPLKVDFDAINSCNKPINISLRTFSRINESEVEETAYNYYYKRIKIDPLSFKHFKELRGANRPEQKREFYIRWAVYKYRDYNIKKDKKWRKQTYKDTYNEIKTISVDLEKLNRNAMNK